MAQPGTYEYALETNRLAQANHQLALTLMDYAVPWRYRTWRRIKKQVDANRDVVLDRMNRHAAAMGWDSRVAA